MLLHGDIYLISSFVLFFNTNFLFVQLMSLNFRNEEFKSKKKNNLMK